MINISILKSNIYYKEKIMHFRGMITSHEMLAKGILLFTMYVIFIALQATGGSQGPLGFVYLRPGESGNSLGILFAQLSHGNEAHFKGNMLILIVLLFLMSYVSNSFVKVLASIMWIGSLLIWFRHPPTIYSGASPMIFGLLVYIPLKSFLNVEFFSAQRICIREGKRKLFWKNILHKGTIILFVIPLCAIYKSTLEGGLPGDVYSMQTFNSYFQNIAFGVESLHDTAKNQSGQIISRWSHLYGAVAGFTVFVVEALYSIHRLLYKK